MHERINMLFFVFGVSVALILPLMYIFPDYVGRHNILIAAIACFTLFLYDWIRANPKE